jgi:outer membrane receptor protein involved in Fe transport
LVPEESDTYTYGIILQPRFLPKLAMSIDYFDIEIDDTISTVGPTRRSMPATSPETRDPAPASDRNENGSLWRGDGNVEDLNQNIGKLTTKGWDLNVTYNGVEMGRFGQLNFNLTATLLDELTTDFGVQGVEPLDCAGLYSGATCGIPNPEWRHHFRTGWETPWNVDLSLTWRYYDSVENSVPLPRTTSTSSLDSQNYFDLAANWQVTEKASVLLGINNVLDEDPPITSAVGTTGNGNTFPQTYDALGAAGSSYAARSGSDTGLRFEQLAAASQGAAAFFLGQRAAKRSTRGMSSASDGSTASISPAWRCHLSARGGETVYFERDSLDCAP